MKRIYQVLPLCFLLSCATYYQMNLVFNQAFESGDMVAAEKTLEANPKAADSKEKFLYFLNRGTIAAMLNKPEESNIYFEKAFIYGEDYRTNYFNEAGAYVINPTIIEYKGEDHEHLLLLYYKALNYIKLGDRESALVECRRLNNRLLKLNDKYRSDSKYKRDAFIHNLMGLIYDADRDYNNAFIAYRNAYNIYKEDYTRMFGVSPPTQLKKDLLRTAYLMGFQTELTQYEQEFQMRYEPETEEGGDLVFLWNNGLGPVKDEFSINFTVVHGETGMITFVNEERGYNFSFPIEQNDDDEDGADLSDLEFYRVAIPKYNERLPLFNQASLTVNDNSYSLEAAEDINKIAFYSLEQRMGLELSKSLLRLALKKLAEKKLREESEGWGAVLGAVNAYTEKADTRNWQTIPHTIYYTRARLPVGVSTATLNVNSGREISQDHEFTFHTQNGQTIFHSFYSLETIPQGIRSQY
ncbi:COG3014 family protein [Reichenbachiella sp.]|uniref:COG3014 family protein n=1 Tax=Reichenbachiella sp. TaxID=2184521 RepID=UPI003B5CAF1D